MQQQSRLARAASAAWARLSVRAVLSAGVAASLFACGGGDAPPNDAKSVPPFASAKVADLSCATSSGRSQYRMVGADCMRTTDVLSTTATGRAPGAGPLAAPTAGVTPAAAFAWAEANYPNYFPVAGRTSGSIAPFEFRYYPATQTYLAISTGNAEPAVYLYGALTGWEARYLAPLVDLTCAIVPQNCVLSASSPSLSMSAYEGAGKQASFTVTYPPVAGVLSVQAAPGTPWLSAVLQGTDSVQVTASAEGLLVGAFNSSIRLTFARADGVTMTKDVPVALTVGKGLLAPANRALGYTAASTQQSLSGSVQITRTDGAAMPWSAMSSQPWLVLAPASGTTGGFLGYSINTAATSFIPNNTDASATVTLSGPNVTAVSFQVLLHKQLPEVTVVMPYGIPVGSEARVIAGGSGFLQLQNPASAVQVAGQVVSAVQVLSDTQLSFKVTPAASGAFAVTVVNGAQGPSPVNLQVTEANGYVNSSVAHDGFKDRFVFDPVRQAVYATTWVQNALYRYQYIGGAWTVTAKAVTQPFGVGLSPDGKRLFVTQTSSVKEFNPDTLDFVANYPVPGGVRQGYGERLAVTADNRLWLPGSYSFGVMTYLDLQDNTIKSVPVQQQYSVESAAFIPSLDGSVMLVSPDYCCSPREPWHFYRSADASVSAPMGGVEFDYDPRVNQDGTRLMLQYSGELYDGAFNLLGQVPAAATGEFYARMALTPDGKRIIATASTGNYYTTGVRIDVFDTTTLSPGTTRFAKVGSIPVTDFSENCHALGNNDYGCLYGGYLIATQDSKAVIWVGNARLQLLKLP